MIVLKEGLEILNYPLAAALAMLMLGAGVLATLLIGRAVALATPWIAGRAPRVRFRPAAGLRADAGGGRGGAGAAGARGIC
jgi:hypothetical protein